MTGSLLAQLTLSELCGETQNNTPWTIGIPLEKGRLWDGAQLALQSEQGELLACTAEVSARWPDNSIKWLLLSSESDFQANQQYSVDLLKRATPAATTEGIAYTNPVLELTKRLVISCQSCQLVLSTERFSCFDIKLADGRLLAAGQLRCVIEGLEYRAKIDNWNYHVNSDGKQALAVDVQLEGILEAGSSSRLNFTAQLKVHLASGLIELQLSVVNPYPAQHAGGKWDLGDRNSFYIDELAINFNYQQADSAALVSAEQPYSQALHGSLYLEQHNSGGKAARSPIHQDRHQQCPFEYDGYRLSGNGELLEQGCRAEPHLALDFAGFGLRATIDQFWQSFPSALSLDAEQVSLAIVPKAWPLEFELQPGERLSRSFSLQLAAADKQLPLSKQRVLASLSPEHYQQAEVFPHFSSEQICSLNPVIQDSLDLEKGFVAKREWVDEYGWRNFGELYADHETEGYQGEDLFVSHYNNQYDPIYGFLRQFALGGAPEWQTLAGDLAQHVTNIDIYHTQRDKAEYNGGLFWHTDHYVKAETATHRTYSSHQAQNVYQDHAGGGGPGGQHCYTSGLLYHYLMTGNKQSKQAVLQLADWISYVYEGQNTHLDLLLGLKNRHRIDLKNRLTGRYPLDRGVANYVIALLDKYQLSMEASLLDRVAAIIQATIAADDDISQRNFANVEETWFYTVFLQAAYRYLWLKEQADSLDDDYRYALQALVHYAKWMASNEDHYLAKPEVLEFPNLTWCAQDLRKVNVLLMAASYLDGAEAAALESKAWHIHQEISQRITSDKHRHYTRIQALLLQNHGVVDAYSTLKQRVYQPELFAKLTPQSSEAQSFPVAAAKAWLEVLVDFSPRRELQRLGQFSAKAAKVLGVAYERD